MQGSALTLKVIGRESTQTPTLRSFRFETSHHLTNLTISHKIKNHALPLQPQHPLLLQAQDRPHPQDQAPKHPTSHHNKVAKPAARTSQALRRAAPLSRKKAKKLERKEGFARRRRMEEMGEVEMKDVDDAGMKKKGKVAQQGTTDGLEAEGKMDVDGVE